MTIENFKKNFLSVLRILLLCMHHVPNSLLFFIFLFWTSVFFYFGCMRKFEILENWFSDISWIGILIHLLSFCHLLIHFWSF